MGNQYTTWAKQTVKQRFMAMVSKGEDPDDCWTWTGCVNDGGYGRFALQDEKKRWVLAHRFAHQKMKGPVPEGVKVLHSCDNPPCVNPRHLFVGTQTVNMQDCLNKGRRPQAKVNKTMATEIRARYEVGDCTQRALAAEFGLSPAQINRIVNGVAWQQR